MTSFIAYSVEKLRPLEEDTGERQGDAACCTTTTKTRKYLFSYKYLLLHTSVPCHRTTLRRCRFRFPVSEIYAKELVSLDCCVKTVLKCQNCRAFCDLPDYCCRKWEMAKLRKTRGMPVLVVAVSACAWTRNSTHFFLDNIECTWLRVEPVQVLEENRPILPAIFALF
jgi:hypothetical protein